MITKKKTGKSFGGCVRYVLNAEGVLVEDAATIIRDFAVQHSGRPEIKQLVGHIAVAFSLEDSGKMTNDFMLKPAYEYMRELASVTLNISCNGITTPITSISISFITVLTTI